MNKFFLYIITFSLIQSFGCKSTAGMDLETPFPQTNYEKVEILTLDSSIYDLDDIPKLQDSFGLRVVDENLGFVDSLGNPFISKYKKIELDKQAIKDLQNIFAPVSSDSTPEYCSCIAIYRDVIVFIDSTNKVVAHINICFAWKDAVFHPKADYMSHFDKSNRWDSLKMFFRRFGIKVKDSYEPPPPNPPPPPTNH